MFGMGEFDPGCLPIPRDGMTSIDATMYLRKVRPDVAAWTVWTPMDGGVAQMIRDASQAEGAVGAWRWKRVDCTYPAIVHYQGSSDSLGAHWRWTGLVELTGPDGEAFLLFSFLTSRGDTGSHFLVSTTDTSALNRFQKDVQESGEKTREIRIDMGPHRDLYLSPESDEWIILPPALREDIETQVFAFFQRRAVYERLGVPYRRGLLFAGPPGCGKTMMVRRLIRECHRRFEARIFSLRCHGGLDQDDLSVQFLRAASASPSIVILDDMDSLTKETQITRAAFLEQLDGIRSPEGMLVVGTTNNPGEIDPALAHRPSRFDRVWHFPLPDGGLRTEYLLHAMDDLDAGLRDEVVRATEGWSFAYLNELRISAAILALQDGRDTTGPEHVRKALALLAAQFKSGAKGHVEPVSRRPVGFSAAPASMEPPF